MFILIVTIVILACYTGLFALVSANTRAEKKCNIK